MNKTYQLIWLFLDYSELFLFQFKNNSVIGRGIQMRILSESNRF